MGKARETDRRALSPCLTRRLAGLLLAGTVLVAPAAMAQEKEIAALKAVLAAFFLALAVPAGVLIVQAYGQLKWQSFRSAQVAAAVPPVARTSSTTSTRDPSPHASTWTSTRSEPRSARRA